MQSTRFTPHRTGIHVLPYRNSPRSPANGAGHATRAEIYWTLFRFCRVYPTNGVFYPTNGVSGGWLGLGGPEPVAEADGKSVENRFPPHGPSFSAGPGPVQRTGHQVQAFDRSLLYQFSDSRW